MITKKFTLRYFMAALLVCSMASGAFAQVPDFSWANSAKSDMLSESESICRDQQGNIYTTGGFVGTLTIDAAGTPVVLSSNGETDVFIKKEDSAGNLIRAVSFGGWGIDKAYGIVSDNESNIYVLGSFRDMVDFDPSGNGTPAFSAGVDDFFLVKYDSAGSLVWYRTFGETGQDVPLDITIDNAGDVYITGTFRDSITVGTTIIRSALASIIIKVDAAGNPVWHRYHENMTAAAVESDKNGHIYLTGGYAGTVPFDQDTLKSVEYGALFTPPAPTQDIFVSKMDTAGNYIWAKSMGGQGSERGQALQTDPYGNVVITGYYGVAASVGFSRPSPNADFNPGNDTFLLIPPVAGPENAFILKLTGDGDFAWAVGLGNKSLCSGRSIATDDYGNIYTTGVFYDTIDFDPGPADFHLHATPGTILGVNIYPTDIFLLKLDTAGKFMWAQQIGGKGRNISTALTTDGKGELYITGYFTDTTDFDPGASAFLLISDISTATSIGTSNDPFVLKLGECIPVGDPMSIAGPDTVCKNTVYPFSIPGVPGALSYTWTLPDGSMMTTETGDILAATGIAGAISVQANGRCDTSSSRNITLSISMPDPMINPASDTLYTTPPQSFTYWRWYRNDTLVSEGPEDSVIVADHNGTYSVVVSNDMGCTDTASYLVNNVYVADMGQNGHAVNVYPNPAGNVFFFSATTPAELFLYTMDGKSVLTPFSYHGTGAVSIDISMLPDGLYLAEIRHPDGILIRTVKLLKAQ